MNRLTRVLFVLAVIPMPSALAQDATADRYSRSAALLEKPSWVEIGKLDDVISNPARPVSREAVEIITRLRGTRPILLRAAARPHCDFGLADRNPRSTVPHLALFERAYKLLLADAVLRLQEDDPGGAVASIDGVLGMAGHLRADRFEMSSQKAMWMVLHADGIIAHAQSTGALDPARAEAIARRLRTFDTRDPVGSADMAAATIDETLHWYASLYDSGQLELLQQYVEGFGQAVPDLSAVERDAFFSTLETAAEVFDDAVDVLASVDDAATQDAAIRQVLSELDSNALATALFPWRGNLVMWSWQQREARAAVNGRLETLAALATGALGRRETANAAFWYARAARELGRVPFDAWEELLEGIASGAPEDPSDDQHQRWLAHLERAHATLAEATEIEHCDFTVLRLDPHGVTSYAVCAAPDYVVGVWEGLQLFCARARRAARAGDGSAAVEELGTALGVVHDLATDAPLISSVVAHLGFRSIFDGYNRLDTELSLPLEERERFGAAVRALAPSDPFGYTHSRQAARLELPTELACAAGLDPTVSGIDLATVVPKWSEDELMAGVLASEHSTEATDCGATHTCAFTNDRRAGRLLHAALGDDLRHLAGFGELLRSGVALGHVDDLPSLSVRRLEPLRAVARSELRDAIATLGRPPGHGQR